MRLSRNRNRNHSHRPIIVSTQRLYNKAMAASQRRKTASAYSAKVDTRFCDQNTRKLLIESIVLGKPDSTLPENASVLIKPEMMRERGSDDLVHADLNSVRSTVRSHRAREAAYCVASEACPRT
jgi:hypothetical protein